MDALNQSLKEQQDENARLREMLEAEKNKRILRRKLRRSFVGTSASVFFNINSDKIAEPQGFGENVKEMAEYAKNNNAKDYTTG